MDATENALQRAKKYHQTKNSVFCADAFFPFTDAPENLIQEGCIGGLVPAGGKKYSEMVKFFKDKNLIVGFMPEQYRGFCRH